MKIKKSILALIFITAFCNTNTATFKPMPDSFAKSYTGKPYNQALSDWETYKKIPLWFKKRLEDCDYSTILEKWITNPPIYRNGKIFLLSKEKIL